jgi:RNA polymerase sigma factor (TIGR02999 family)
VQPNLAVTQLLEQWRKGDARAMEQLAPVIYSHLHRMAGRHMSSERPGHTLSTTGLVNEAFLRLASADIPSEDRAHFFALASTMMRRILVDHAKAARAAKRGSGAHAVDIEDIDVIAPHAGFKVLELDQALDKLKAIDGRKVELIELLFFGGLTYEEAAQAMNISAVTVHRELKVAKAWLYRELGKPTAPVAPRNS